MKIGVMLDGNVVSRTFLADETYVAGDNEMLFDDTCGVERGFTYNNDGTFNERKPYDSWVLSDSVSEGTLIHRYVAPTPMPEPDSDGDNTMWEWDEDTTSWVTV